MRVVSGTARGTKLHSVPGESTRPILDRVKTALFDTLRPRIQSATVLDLFAGTGSIGIEALSQGATRATFIDINDRAVATIRKNLELAHLSAHAEVRHTDAFSYVRSSKKSFDLIFVAPPQYQALWVQAIHTIAERPEIVSKGGLVVAQIDPREYEALDMSEFTERENRKYGNTLIVFFERTIYAPAE